MTKNTPVKGYRREIIEQSSLEQEPATKHRNPRYRKDCYKHLGNSFSFVPTKHS